MGSSSSRIGQMSAEGSTDPEDRPVRLVGRHGRLLKTETAAASPGLDLAFYVRSGRAAAGSYCAGCSASPAFLRLSQLYFFWKRSMRPVVSMNFCLPVKNGWQAEQISTVIFLRVLRVVN